MKKTNAMRRALGTMAAFLLVSAAFAAAGGPLPGELRADPEVQPVEASNSREKSVATRRRAAKPVPVSLGRPAPGDVAALSAPRRPGVPMPVGFGRALDALASPADTARHLQWETVEDGRQVAAIVIESPEAAAIRVALRVVHMPDAAVVRFEAEGAAEVHEVRGAEINEAIARNEAAGEKGPEARTWYSPVLESFAGVVEFDLPAGTKASELRISIPHVSHLVQSPRSDMLVAKASASCHVDASCSTATWGAEINAVARMIFSAGGSSYLCTGTLLADGDSSTAIPYFLSANHCISTQSAASSLVTYWFYRSTACNSGMLGPSQVRSSGATLLRASAATDVSFMRLNTAPPAGATYAGWIAGVPATGVDVTGLHHPAGDLQKISHGDIAGYATCTAPNDMGQFSCSGTQASSSTFYVVTWRSGVTQGGSSGSGLFRDQGRYLVGQLYGGSSSCSEPGAGDLYGRFDVAYSSGLSQWLAGTTSPPPPPPPPSSYTLAVSRAGVGTGTVTSSPSGINCGSQCSASFASGSVVTLSAAPSAGSAFTGWSGACSGTGNCTVTLGSSKSVTANFTPLFTLSVSKVGAGTVRSSPAAIDCGASCAVSGVAGATYTLVATPATGYRFAGWSGGSCTGTGSCVVALTANRAAVATFSASPPETVAMGAPRADFNADGKADLTWRSAAGQHGLWLMDAQRAPTYAVLEGPAGARIAQLADFDGDGKTDVLWRAADGAYSITLMDGTVRKSHATLLAGGSGWEVIGRGDFDGDGKGDLAWRHASGQHGVWLMDGIAARSYTSLAGPGATWNVAAIGDFDGNGKADLLWRNPEGTTTIELMDGGTATSSGTIEVSVQWAPAFVADFNGDAKADIIWRRASDGQQGVWLMNGATATTYALASPGAGWSTLLAADFNGDGKSDLVWRDPAGNVRVALMDGAAESSYANIAAGASWLPVRATDLDGDGKADLVWKSTAGAYGTWLMDGTTMRSYASVLAAGSGWDVSP